MIRRISDRPDVQSRLHSELLEILPYDAGDRTFTTIDSLPYLNAVIMEGLRLVDTISSYQTRKVPKGGCVISGHLLPAGVCICTLLEIIVSRLHGSKLTVPQTIVAAQPYIINRQPNIFPNPDTFDPSRWLLPRESYRSLAKSMWTYSSGPRSCIGRELSLAST